MAPWKKLIVFFSIFAVVVYALFQVGYYATSIPQFCGSCHEIEKYVTSWEGSAHNAINCLDCHQPSGELGKIHAKARGLNYVFKHVSGNYTIPTEAPIFEQNCIQCHLGDSKRYPNTVRMKNTSEINHYESIRKAKSCLECHRETGHDVDIYLTPDLRGAK